MRILVTGASGFLGRHLVATLVKQGEHEVLAMSRGTGTASGAKKIFCDLTCEEQVRIALEFYKPDMIMHFAGVSHPKDSEANLVMKTNVLATEWLLRYAPRNCRFVFASSSAVYSNHKIGENYTVYEHDQVIPSSLYGASKLCGETLIQTYHAQGRIANYLILRLANVVGGDKGYGIIHEVCSQFKAKSKTIRVRHPDPKNHGLAEYQFLVVTDAIEAIVGLAESPISGLVNVAVSGTATIQDIIDFASLECCDSEYEVIWGKDEPTQPVIMDTFYLESCRKVTKVAKTVRVAPDSVDAIAMAILDFTDANASEKSERER